MACASTAEFHHRSIMYTRDASVSDSPTPPACTRRLSDSPHGEAATHCKSTTRSESEGGLGANSGCDEEDCRAVLGPKQLQSLVALRQLRSPAELCAGNAGSLERRGCLVKTLAELRENNALERRVGPPRGCHVRNQRQNLRATDTKFTAARPRHDMASVKGVERLNDACLLNGVRVEFASGMH